VKISAIMLVICLIVFGAAMAQDDSIPYVYSASSAPTATTYFNFDITSSLFYDPSAIHEVIYRDAPATTWSSGSMALFYQACSTYTYSGSINYQPPSDLLEWYFRSENDTVVVSQSPKNSSDQFPVPEYLLADLGADSVGDAGATNLDITHLYGSYSDTKLYFRFDNNGGGFPTSGGLLTYYMYAIGILNPNQTDSTVYLLIYAVNPLFSTGLYSMSLSDSSFSQVGSVSSNISGNSLTLSCNISDLVAQPGWPTWPPEYGFIGAAPVAVTSVIATLTYNDFGKAAIFMPLSHMLDFSAVNNAPTLDLPSVIYDDTGLVTAEITYTDVDNHLAVERSLYFEGTPYDMTACEKDYENGAVFQTELTVGESGWYHYYFEFSDGDQIVSTATDSVYVDLQTFVCGDANGDETVNIFDITYIITYLYREGPAPDPLDAADVNNDGTINIFDITYLISFLYLEGPAPNCP
jgi:hypothetical protein